MSSQGDKQQLVHAFNPNFLIGSLLDPQTQAGNAKKSTDLGH